MQKTLKILLITTLFVSSLSILPLSFGWDGGDTSTIAISENNDVFFYGAYDIDDYGFPEPPNVEDYAVSAWRHPTFDNVVNIQSELYDSGADWIWRVYKATEDESQTGSVVFFQKEIEITEEFTSAVLSITADNAFYVFVSSEVDGATGPFWGGEPISGTDPELVIEPIWVSGFTDGEVNGAFEDIGDIVLPRKGKIITDSSVMSSIEHINLVPFYDVTGPDDEPYEPGLKLGMNWLTIVAVNAQPQPNDKWTSQNTAGLIYKLEITTGEEPLEFPDGIGFTFPVGTDIPPDDLSIITDSLPLNVPVPIQAAFQPDYDDDGYIDLIKGKEATILVRASPGTVSVQVDFPGYSEISTTKDVDDIFYFPNFTPVSGTGEITGPGLGSTFYEVIDTAALEISYYALDGTDIKKGYGSGIGSNFEPETTDFLEAVFPVETVTVDGTNGKTIPGAEKGSRKDPYKGMITDAIQAAQDAQLRLGGSAIGIAIGPDIDGKKDYFEYQGFPGAAGVSFGPSVKGVVVLDGYWTSVAHEISHTFGVYWGEPEQYQVDPIHGTTTSGMWIEKGTGTNYWAAGLDIMGVGPWETLEDTWILTETYEKLTEQLKEDPADPAVLLASGIIYAPSDSNPEKSVELVIDWVWMDDGYPDTFETSGDYSLAYSATKTGKPIRGLPREYFDAPYSVNVFPQLGTPLSRFLFSEIPNNFGAFAFSTVYPDNENIRWIQLWDHTGKKPVLLKSLEVEVDVIHAFVEADFTYSGVLEEGEPITFTDQSSTAPGELVDWNWDFGDGSQVSGDVPDRTHSYNDDGTYTVALTVTDEYGRTDTTTQELVIANVSPTADAGDDQLVDEGENVGFSGSATDPGADTLSYSWSFGDGGTGTGATPTHVYFDNGVYIATLTVDDGDGGTGTDTLTVTVNNVAPTVDAGADKSGDEGSAVTIDPASFTDPGSLDTHTALIDWGDSTFVDLGTVTSPISVPSHTYADNGDYTVTVTVTDSDGGSGSDSLVITVNNVSPTVDAGDDQSVDEGDIVTFSGSATDPGDDTFTYSWLFGDGGSGTGAAPTHVYLNNGVYTASLTVDDGDGGTGTDTVIVTVLDLSPIADFSWSPTIQNEGSSISFSDLSTSYPDDIASWSWDFGGLDTSSAQSPSFTFLDDGTYDVVLTVTDEDGSTDSVTHTVTVNDLDPNALFSWSPEPQDEGSPVDFTDASTSSPDTIVGWSWDFGGLGTSTAQNPSYTFDDDGAYDVVLTVTDDDGSTDSVTHTVTINVVEPPGIAWVTDSAFNEIEKLDPVIKKTKGSSGYTLQNTNPGGIMYNLLEYDQGPFELEIQLPILDDGSNAFNLQGLGNPVHVYSDLDRTSEITSATILDEDDANNRITVSVPGGRDDPTVYITIHLVYAEIGRTDLPNKDYHQDLWFNAIKYEETIQVWSIQTYFKVSNME